MQSALASRQISILVTMILLLVGLYSFGITGDFYYDDVRPISNLAKVTDISTAFYYVFTEISGPLGRPISMLTFLLHTNTWSESPQYIFIVNILIHGLNTLAVFSISYCLAFFYNQGVTKQNKDLSPFWLALLATYFWAVLPLHVSSSLIAIQRMTTLSAFFVLAGIAIYLYGLKHQYLHTIKTNNSNHNVGLTFQLTGLIFFTLLAMFSKENGVLLPLFIFTLEITILSALPAISYRRTLRVLSTFSALIIIFCYLVYRVQGEQELYIKRDFDVFERVLTQATILFDYLKLAFFPEVNSFNPYHDDYPVVRNITPMVILKFLFWPILLLLACKYKKKYPLAAFAVIWFLSAHILESTVIGLELYFEHRNYIAMFGPCIAIVFSINQLPGKYKKLIIYSFSFYLLLLTFSLYQTTTLWGNPKQASQAWFLQQPGSLRAGQKLSDLYLERNQTTQALEILDLVKERCPRCLSATAQAMLISCSTGDNEKTIEYYNKLIVSVKGNIRFANLHGPLSILQQHIEQGHCKTLNYEHLKKLNFALLERKDLTFDKRVALIINLHQIAVAENDQEENIRLLKMAWYANKDVGISAMLTKYQINNGKLLEAQDFIFNELCQHEDINPLKMKKITLACESSKQLVNSLITTPSGH